VVGVPRHVIGELRQDGGSNATWRANYAGCKPRGDVARIPIPRASGPLSG